MQDNTSNVYETPVKVADPTSQAQPPVTTEAPPQPIQPVVAEPTPQQTNREQIYQQYNNDNAPNPEPIPLEPPVVEQHESSLGAKVEPIQPPQPTPTENLQAEVAELKTMLKQTLAQQAAPAPVAPPPEAVPDVPAVNIDEQWIEAYKEGRTEDGARMLAQVVQKYGANDQQQSSQETVLQAVEMVEAKSQIAQAAATAATNHPELTAWEPYIKAAVDADMAQAQKDGQVKSYSDFATLYTKFLNERVEGASKISQSNRASGAENANVRTSEVVSKTVITPQGVSPFGESQTEQPEAPPTNPHEAYMKARQDSQYKRDGMSVPG
jgi:hypothetical protein